MNLQPSPGSAPNLLVTAWVPVSGTSPVRSIRGHGRLCLGAEALFSLGVSVVSCPELRPSLEPALLLLGGLDVGVLLWAMQGGIHPEAHPSKLPLSCGRWETSNLQARTSSYKLLLIRLLAWPTLPGSRAWRMRASQHSIWKWFVQEMGQGARESRAGPGRLHVESTSCGPGTRAIQPSARGTLLEAGLNPVSPQAESTCECKRCTEHALLKPVCPACFH